MDISTHWVVTPPRWDGKITEQYVVDDIEVDGFRTQGWKVEGPFVLASQLAEAVGALRWYADEGNWSNISEHGTITTNTPARRDAGQRARDALKGTSPP